MTAMSANTETLPKRHRVTVNEYHRMGEAEIFSEDDRVELINGEIIDMTPIGSRYASVVDELNYRLIRQIAGTYRIRVQNPLQLAEDTEPQPDLAIVRRRSDRYAGAHPAPQDVLLLIEVADTSASYDRSVKIPLYARHSIPEVWLVDLADESVEVFRNPALTGYVDVDRHERGESLKPLLMPEVEIDLVDLFGAG
jgi:Uma2 family endonuclease